MGLPSRRWFQQRSLGFRLVHVGGEDRDNGSSDFILHRKDVFQLSIVSFGPTVGARRCIDELSRDADALSCSIRSTERLPC